MKYFFVFTFSLVTLIHAKITPPNYDFNLSTIENFFPSKSIEDMKKKYPKFETIEDSGGSKLLKFRTVQKDYALDIFVQVKGDKIVDTFIRMPQYFNHDLFLKELQTKWKKQDKYKRKDGSALYTWFNRDSMNILYHGSCSITCFPMFIEFITTDKGVTPLYTKFNEAI